jgi:hypothetical protein
LERSGGFHGSELHTKKYFVWVIDAAKDRVAFRNLLATQRVCVELLLEGVKIPLKDARKECHAATSWSVGMPRARCL